MTLYDRLYPNIFSVILFQANAQYITGFLLAKLLIYKVISLLFHHRFFLFTVLFYFILREELETFSQTVLLIAFNAIYYFIYYCIAFYAHF